ncbi:MAG: transposase [Methanosarcinales archaeon]|nr:transposase [Methanosarcinales archaeon]
MIYVVSTEDKVILDFQITNRMPSFIELVPLMNRIQNRLPEGDILKIVSDEDDAIIGSVERIFPNVAHSFCVFHQLQNVTTKYLDEFKDINEIPSGELELYGLAKNLILAGTVIESAICYQNILEIASSVELSKASKKVISYIKKVYSKNEKLLKKGFTPETNNVMEQLFALISDIITQARSFKKNEGLSNFCYNLFVFFNKNCFNTGEWKGFSPLDRAKIKFG